MGERTKLCDYTNTPNDQFITRAIATPEIKADSYEVSPSLLNLIPREQFCGSAMEDSERACVASSVVMVSNDNPYGLMFSLRYSCRSCPQEKFEFMC